MIDKEIKEKFSSIRFNELEEYMPSYQSRFYGRLVPKSNKPDRLLGYNGINFLLNSLQRSRCIFIGFIDCINRTHRGLAYLAARAHFETTGLVAYFLRYIQKFYQGEIKYEDIDDLLLKLSVGGRTFPEKNTHPERPEAVNVLTLIDGADKVFIEMGGDKNIFRSCYDYLSEFCHPNWAGLTIGSDIVDEGDMHTVVYYATPEFKEEDFVILINYMLISCSFFFNVYDKCFALIKDNEELPDLIG
jgi:hypothetical protein